MTTRRFYAVELDVYGAGSAISALHGWLAYAHLAKTPDETATESAITVLASDVGYRTLPGDATQAIYPALLDTAFEVDRAAALAPGETASAAAWGSVRMLNPNGQWDTTAAALSCDGRRIRILSGVKGFDPVRGIELDPAYSSLLVAFSGVAQNWFLSEAALEVPLRDATYWMERPLQSSVYQGTGTYEGTAQMVGVPKPKTRGGTSSNPVCNVSPVLVDPSARIYAISDGPATVVNLYEGGASTITFQADTTNLYIGSTSAGQYRTDKSRGLFQLGGTPARAITADVFGNFPSAGVVNTAAKLARYLIAEDMAMPSDMLDTTSFDALDTAFPYTSGWFFGPQQIDGAASVGPFLRAIGAKLVPSRAGKLKAIALRALAAGTTPTQSLTTAEIVSCLPRRLPAPLDPPAFRWFAGYQGNNTPQTTDLAGSVTDARKQFLANAWRSAGYSSGAVLAAFRRPSDPPLIETALLLQSDAQSLANAMGALWSTRRRLYDVTLPVEVGILLDIGDVVSLTFPVEDLAGGKLGQVVGERYRSTDAVTTLSVLV